MTQNLQEEESRNGSRGSKNKSEISIMDTIVEEMTEYVCDELCRYTECSEEELLRRCDECRINEFQRRILNEYS